LLNTAERLKRVSVTDPSVADAVVVSPTQVVINGKAPGEVSLVLWDQQERSRTFDLRVDVDVTNAAEEVKRVFPDEQIQVSASRNAVVLSGHVSTKEVAERASVLVGAFSKNVVNVLSFGPVGAQEILLEVKFAEVDRTALAQYGVNLFSTGAANTFGATSTQQHGPFSGSTVGSVTSDVTAGTAPPGSHATTGEIGRGNFHNPATFSTNDILNLFLFRADVNVGAIVKALQQKNVLQILAEPNLIAVNGKEASFLAGGEFPIPVVQGIGGTQTVTIQFKEFGVRLKFLPVVMPNGNMHMRVTPEVSTLDFTNALTISGFTIPALSTRRADTEFEVQDGQSFVIAGLLDNRVTNVAAKVPGLGNIPILGYFFRSKTLQKSKSELMVLVTARRISPSPVPQQLPKPALPYLDPGKFDVGKPGGAQ
jgi:pilus assembly protein CpaC